MLATAIENLDVPIDGLKSPAESPLRDLFVMIRLRWVAGTGVAVAAGVLWLSGMRAASGGLLAIGAVILAGNVAFILAARRVRATGSAHAPNLATSQMALDLLALAATALVWGGIGNPVIYLLSPVVLAWAGLILPRARAYLLAAGAVAMYAGVAILHATSPTLYQPLTGGPSSPTPYPWTVGGLLVTVLAVTCFAAATLTTALAGRLKAQRKQIRSATGALQTEQLERGQQEKMAAIGMMAAGVAHEIGNPLACMSALAQVLRRREPDGKTARQLAELEEHIKRITRIVRDLLDFARPGNEEVSPCDLDALIAQSLKMVRYSHRARHARIDAAADGTMPPVRLSARRFQQVLINVVLNALDAVKDLEGEAVVRIERSVEDGWADVRVIDAGVGMTPTQQRQVFEPFYTTKAPGEGTGLGLAVSYRLVQRQGGRIRIRSKPSEGTTVTISFPITGAQRPTATDRSETLKSV